MNIVIYARYSSERQTEASIEGQLKVCYEYAERQGYHVIGEYIDRALSGKTSNRPKFQKMINDSEKKQFQAVLVYQLDRFSRNRYDSAISKAKLRKNGVSVISARENISDDASGVLMESVLEGMAEYYSAELSQKVTRGMRLNAEKCLYNGGTVPFGYKIVDKKYVIDKEKAPFVKNIFEMYANSTTIKEIIAYLNNKNLKTSTGTAFNYNSLHTMLKNKKYIGIYKFKDIEVSDGIPKIIDDELFERVQAELKKNHKSPARAKAIEEYLLTTKLFCGYCKEMMVGVSGTSKNHNKYCYYSCNSARSKKADKCHKKNVSKKYIEDFVVNQCRKQLTDENIKIIVDEVIQANQSDEGYIEIKRIEKEIKQLNKEKNNLLSSLKSCNIESVKQDIFSEIGRVNEQIKTLEAEFASVKNDMTIIDETEVLFFLNQLKKGDINDFKYRKMLITVFVNRIYLYDNKITFVFNTDKKPVTITHEFIDSLDNIMGSGCSDKCKTSSPSKNLRNYVVSKVFCLS